MTGGAYAELLEFQKESEALSQISGLLEWDQETCMPKGGYGQRAELMGAVSSALHERQRSDRLGELLAAVDLRSLDETGAANVRHVRRRRDRAMRIPADLPKAIARAGSKGYQTWVEARKENDFNLFRPVLAEMVWLKRQEAQAVSEEGRLYDALLDEFEPGMTSDHLDAMFAAMRPRLVSLAERIFGSETRVEPLAGEFPETAQLALARDVATRCGYDWNRGRLDLAVHPSTVGAGNDVRITTRVDEANPFNCIYSTIHEAGHALYELNVAQEHLLTPVGGGVSMGVHESQSRMFENQLGRSFPFCGWLAERMGEEFGIPGIGDARSFYAKANRVARQPIRTEANEVHYNLHIMLRYDLEKELIAGRLETENLEEAWNERFRADFGFEVDSAANGVLQDVHWSVGLFGYFPAYALGNVYAGCLHAALRKDLPNLDGSLSEGYLRPAAEWLADRVHRFGGLREPVATVERASGGEVSEGPLLDYLEAKFGEIYKL